MELAYSVPRSGLYTAAFLQNGMTSRQAETAASASNIETRALDRFTLKRKRDNLCPSLPNTLLAILPLAFTLTERSFAPHRRKHAGRERGYFTD
jgi:hypothetical protein